jgi:hypothetical protein
MWAERQFVGRDLRSINLLIHATINGVVSEQVHVSPVIRQRFVNRCLRYEELILGSSYWCQRIICVVFGKAHVSLALARFTNKMTLLCCLLILGVFDLFEILDLF